MPQKRLSKVLAECAVSSRRRAEELIQLARVEVNGKIILTPQHLVDLDTDKIKVDDKIIRRQKKKYILLNKPKGYVCTHTKLKHQKIVFDLFPPMREKLFTVGRLDKDTTGLLLVTNDGHFANQITHPSARILKEYVVETKEPITPAHLQIIQKGAWIEGRRVRPVFIKKIASSVCKISVFDGKKHEVRIFIRKAKLTLKKLMRIRIGNLFLKHLPPGEFKILSEKEKKLIFQNPKENIYS